MRGGRPGAAVAALARLVAWALPAPPVAATDRSPRTFSSEPNPTWGTSASEDRADAGSDRAGKVTAIAEVGDRVFPAGEFTGVMPPGASTNKVRRDPQLAAVEAGTGALRSEWIPPPNEGGHFAGNTGTPVEDGDPGNVPDLKVTPDGRMVVVAGSFLDFAGQTGLLVLDAETARPTSWQPVLDRPRPAYGLDIWPGDDQTIFVAAGGRGAPSRPSSREATGSRCGSTRSTATPWTSGRPPPASTWSGTTTSCSPGAPPAAPAAAPAATRATSQPPHLRLRPADGRPRPHLRDPVNTPEGPDVAVVGAHHLYVGGNFTKVNGAPHPGFVQFGPAPESGPGAPAGATPAG